MQNLSCASEFYLHENKKIIFISDALYKPRFETEACGNSEMSYLHGFQQYSFSYPSRAL